MDGVKLYPTGRRQSWTSVVHLQITYGLISEFSFKAEKIKDGKCSQLM